MQINQPYDPRYNPKVYVPKLTEEQRLARATPLENLRGLRFRSETPAAPSTAEAVAPTPVPAQDAPASPCPSEAAAPSPVQKVPASPAPTEAAATAPLPAQVAPVSGYVPTAWEVVCAEFPDLFGPTSDRVHGKALAQRNHIVSAGCSVGDPEREPPPHPKPSAMNNDRWQRAWEHSKVDLGNETVILAHAGIQCFRAVCVARSLDSHVRGNDRPARSTPISSHRNELTSPPPGPGG